MSLGFLMQDFSVFDYYKGKETTTNNEVATIADEAPAKAATPIETQKGFPYWVLIILAAIAGVSVEEYIRRKNENSKNDSKKN